MKDITKNQIASCNSPAGACAILSSKTFTGGSRRGGGNHEKNVRYRLLPAVVLLLTALPVLLHGQATPGPVIEGAGAVYEIEGPDFPADPGHTYRVVFDIAVSPEDPTEVNQRINTLARFLNMHAQAGVPMENLAVAAVFHGTGTYSVLKDPGYRQRFGTDNPNLGLLEKLKEAGAALYVCGQSLQAREVERAEVTEPVGVALSAMTVLIELQNKGYALIGW